ncbi:hypothetical protein SLE2022_274550 [Rubroshorea leprosula]
MSAVVIKIISREEHRKEHQIWCSRCHGRPSIAASGEGTPRLELQWLMKHQFLLLVNEVLHLPYRSDLEVTPSQGTSVLSSTKKATLAFLWRGNIESSSQVSKGYLQINFFYIDS